MIAKSIAQQLIFDLTGDVESSCSQGWVLVAMHQHGRALIDMLWRILGNEEDVCDAYQDTFFRLAHVKEGQKPDHIKAYLFRTASNTAISIIRQKNQFNKARERIADRERGRTVMDGSGELELEEIRERLRERIAQLPDHLREVVVLRDLAEIPYRQISRILGISQGTARVYRRRAIVQLGTMMADYRT